MWYSSEHRQAHFRFVTPERRHCGDDKKILANPTAVYEAAKKNNPNRWSGATRGWSAIEDDILNPAAPAKDQHFVA